MTESSHNNVSKTVSDQEVTGMKGISYAVLACGIVGCSGGSDGTAALRGNIGKVACNATNGVYVGRIVDVTLYSAPGQRATLVYVVEREGRRQNAPPANTVVVADRCSDGQPATPSAQIDPALVSVATGVLAASGRPPGRPPGIAVDRRDDQGKVEFETLRDDRR